MGTSSSLNHGLSLAVFGALAIAFTAGCSQDLHAVGTSGSGGEANGSGGSQSTSTSTSTASSNGGGKTTGSAGGNGGSTSATGKRGIAYGSNSHADLSALSAGIGWWYNWSPGPDGSLNGDYKSIGVEFVPMIWGGDFDTTKLDTQVPPGAKYLLTFNEPNFGSQANLTPAQAAALWPKIETFASAHNLEIVSPAPNYCGGNCNETSPFDWLDKFFAACTNCKVDYVAFHWYACTKDALSSTLDMYKKYDKPLWITEFSCLDDQTIDVDKETQYMTDAVTLLENDPKVFRYSWFTGRFDSQPAINLLDTASGALTPLGKQYISMPKSP